LAELDHTVYEIRKGFNFEKNGEKIVTRIENLMEEKNPILLNKNCYFGNFDRAELFKEQSYCYVLRVDPNMGILEAYYFTNEIKDDGKFDVEGLKPQSSILS
jgi:hypothetical protein